MHDKTASSGLGSSIGGLLVLGFLFFAASDDEGFNWLGFMGYLVGSVFGWVACKVHYKVPELQEEVEVLQDEVDSLEAELSAIEND